MGNRGWTEADQRYLLHCLRACLLAAGLGTVAAFSLLMPYWELSEAAEPGQQYAHPLLPCVQMALQFGGPVGVVVWLVREQRRARREGRHA